MSNNIDIHRLKEEITVERNINSPLGAASSMMGPKFLFILWFIYNFAYFSYIFNIYHLWDLPAAWMTLLQVVVLFFLPIFLLELLSYLINKGVITSASIAIGTILIGLLLYFIYWSGLYPPTYIDSWANIGWVLQDLFVILSYIWAIKKAFERPFVFRKKQQEHDAYDIYDLKLKHNGNTWSEQLVVQKRGNKFSGKTLVYELTAEASTVGELLNKIKEQYAQYAVNSIFTGQNHRPSLVREMYDGNDNYDEEGGPYDPKTPATPIKTRPKKDDDYSCYT